MRLTTIYLPKRLVLLASAFLMLTLTLVGLQRVQAESFPHAGGVIDYAELQLYLYNLMCDF